MNSIMVDEAINGYMVTIVWENDPIIKEVCETKADMLGIIARWVGKKMDAEMVALRYAAGQVS